MKKTNETIYSLSEEKIKQLIQARECITYLGLPKSGKHKLLKKVIQELKLEEKTVFLSLDAFSEYDSNPTLIENLSEEIDRNYKAGKEIFVFNKMPLDSEITTDLYTAIAKSRQKMFILPSFIFILRSSPYLYKEAFSNCTIAYNNIVYEPVLNERKSVAVINNLVTRFNIDFPEDKIVKKVFQLSGGNPALIKELIRYYINEKDLNLENEELKLNLANLTKQILDEIPNREIELLNLIQKSKKDFSIEINHLQKEGLINEKLEIQSELISTEFKKYSRDFPFTLLNEKVYINGRNVTEEFSSRELLFLKYFAENKVLKREIISSIISKSEEISEVSEYAIDQAISRLRRHLKDLGVNPKIIKTLKSIGFKLELD